jgi:hypothetical protein
MRIERTGPVAKLTPRLERFFIEALGGQALDDVQHAGERKADFKCMRGLLAIELKTLEKDASERMDNLTDELREREDWPMFYGAVPMDAFLKNVKEPEAVRLRIFERIGRAIKNHIHKANKQLAAHEATFPRKNLVKIVVLANEDHEVYDPDTVAYTVQKLLRREENGAPLYPHIDAVIYLSERHAAPIHGQVGFPIVFIEGSSSERAQWKRDVTELFLDRWSRWNGIPAYSVDPKKKKFSTIEHVPEKMRRQELWELQYRRNPYMKDFTKEQIRDRFDEVICVTTLGSMKNSPLKPGRDAMMWSMEAMSHLMIEMGRKAFPITEFPYEPERLAAAARRLGFPAPVLSWFESDLERNPSRHVPSSRGCSP